MAGRVQPIEVVKGESKTLRFTAMDADEARVNLTGATVEFEVHYPPGAAQPPAIAKSIGSGILLGDQDTAATKGDFDVSLSPADTKDLKAKLYKYDVWIVLLGYRRCLVRPSDFRLIETVNPAA
jgi:hypothetical protein